MTSSPTQESIFRLDARDICVEFPQPRQRISVVACWQMSLALRPGEFVSIIGPSGCGKTTFLNVLGGLQRPSAGRVYVNGELVDGPGSGRVMVFQEYGLLPWRTVEENIGFGLEVRGERGAATREKVRDVIDMVGLSAFAKNYPHELSGGMRQRTGLARAIVTDPQILLLDEPFGALDAMTRELLQKEFEAIIQELGISVVLITHSIDEAIVLGDRIVVCTAGPSRTKGEVLIDLPRPRVGHDIKGDPRYQAIYDEVWDLVENEIHEQSEPH